jgi:hypothetical protein
MKKSIRIGGKLNEKWDFSMRSGGRIVQALGYRKIAFQPSYVLCKGQTPLFFPTIS